MKNIWFKKVISCVTLLVFINTGTGTSYAQAVAGVLDLPPAGTMVQVSRSFVPPILKGIEIDPKHPLRIDFILDTGNSELGDEVLEDVSHKLIRYFLASLTIPEKELWVNLSPYEKDRIISDEFSMTEMGRDLLAEDYMLKQITASLIYPENETGRVFWQNVYAAASEKYGTIDIPVDTFNKVWIVPEKAMVYEKGTKVFITKATMKVMLETDYLAEIKNQPAAASVAGEAKVDAELGKKVIREVVIPILEKEVNEGANFAQLRQAYYSLILAKWYKETLKESVITRKYADQKKISGVDLAVEGDKQAIYAQYLEAFKKGAFNYIKEEYDVNTRELLPRKYFSGGCNLEMPPLEKDNAQALQQPGVVTGALKKVTGFLKGAAPRSTAGMGMPELRRSAMVAAVTAVLAFGIITPGRAQTNSTKSNGSSVQMGWLMDKTVTINDLDTVLINRIKKYENIPNQILSWAFTAEDPTDHQVEQILRLHQTILDKVRENSLDQKDILSLIRFVNSALDPVFDVDRAPTIYLKDAFPASPGEKAVGTFDCDSRALMTAAILKDLGINTELVSTLGHMVLKYEDGKYFELTTNEPRELKEDERLQANPISDVKKLLAYMIGIEATRMGAESETDIFAPRLSADEKKAKEALRMAAVEGLVKAEALDSEDLTVLTNFLTLTDSDDRPVIKKKRKDLLLRLGSELVRRYSREHLHMAVPNGEIKTLNDGPDFRELTEEALANDYVADVFSELSQELAIQQDWERAAEVNDLMFQSAIKHPKKNSLLEAENLDLVLRNYLMADRYDQVFSRFDKNGDYFKLIHALARKFNSLDFIPEGVLGADDLLELRSVLAGKFENPALHPYAPYIKADLKDMLTTKLVAELMSGRVKVDEASAEKFYNEHAQDPMLGPLMRNETIPFNYYTVIEKLKDWDGFSQFQAAFKDPRLQERFVQERAVKEASARKKDADEKAAQENAKIALWKAADKALSDFRAGQSSQLSDDEMKVLAVKLHASLQGFYNDFRYAWDVVRWGKANKLAPYENENVPHYINKVVNALLGHEEFTNEDFAEKPDLKGGIDFNTGRIDIERQDHRPAIEWENASLENIEINGLEPVIMNIMSVDNLPQLMS